MLGKIHFLLFLGFAALGGCAQTPRFDEQAAGPELSDCTSLGNVSNDRDLADPKQLKLISEGKEHYRRGEYGLAEQSFRLATETAAFGQNGGSRVAALEAWYGLAASYDQLRRFDMADPIYDHIKSEYGTSVTYYNNYGYSLEMRGEAAKARMEFQRATELAPRCQISRNNLNSVLGN